MVGIGIWGWGKTKKIFSKKMKIIIWKLLRNNYSFLNIFLYIINITYIDINNKLKIKPKPISDIPKESKHKTKWWFENKKLNDGMKIK